MIEPFTSFAQNFEDVFIRRCFATRVSGFYIDVGASHPVRDSPTYASYCQGWSGVNIEPIATRVAELRRLRPRDVTIQAAVGASVGEVVLYRSDGLGGLSSCVSWAMPDQVDRLIVPMLTLDRLCDDYGISDVQILKIDVEGFEEEVLKGFSFTTCRPELVIIEAISPAAGSDDVAWIERLQAVDYHQVYDDAVNRFFVRGESIDLSDHFRKPISVLDNVRQFHAQGSCLTRTDHPDHAWAVHFAEPILRYVASLSDTDTLSMLISDIPEALLKKPVDLDAINRAFYLVLGRWVTSEEVGALHARAEQDGLALKTLIFELLSSREYTDRIARVAASV